MKNKRALCVAALLVFALTTANAAAPAIPYIIIAQSNSLPASLADDVAARGGTLTGSVPEIGVAFAKSSDADFIANMSGVAGLKGVIPDEIFVYDKPTFEIGPQNHGNEGTGIFDFETWGIQAVGAPAAWAAGNTGAGVRVAVLDAGIDPGHPDLAPNINFGSSASYVPCLEGIFLPPGDGNCDGAVEDWQITPGFYFNHGTHVAGTIAGTGNLGVTGVAPDAELVVVKVCTEFFNACFRSSIISGIVHAANVGADLANMSLGGLRRMRNDFVKFCKDNWGLSARECGQIARYYTTFQDDYVYLALLVYDRAFQYARNNGVTVLVSNGNSAINADTSKDIKLGFADSPHTLGISALAPLGWCLDPSTNVDEQASYTNYGQSVTFVSAPGGDFDGFFMGSPYTDPCTVGFLNRPAWVHDMVLSTIAGGWGWAAGTSMAAPHATGVAALLISANGSSMSPAQVEQALKATADDLGQPGKDAVHGHGRVHSGY